MKIKLPVKYSTLTPAERKQVKEQYVLEQKELCYHCNAPLSGPPEESVAKKKIKPKYYPKGFFGNPVHLHHNHVTDDTIGAVHNHCNAVLWEYYGE